MRMRIVAWTLLPLLVTARPLLAQQTAPPRTSTRSTNYGRLPLTFEANHGQTNHQVNFLSRGPGYTAFLTGGAMVLSLSPSQIVTTAPGAKAALTPEQRSKATVDFRLLGAAKNPMAVGEDLQRGKVNYFIGNDHRKWQTNVPTYARVRYKNVYPGIDLVYYGNHRQLEYDFAISPGADLNRIQFEIRGASEIQLDESGDLILKVDGGELHFQSPILYQEVTGQRVIVNGGYVMTDATHVAFHVAKYDQSKPLVIDPVLVYSTYLGGSGDDQPMGIAVDGSGSAYVAGYTNSPDFPLASPGSLPPNSYHVFVAKLDATGTGLVYTDYLGGNSQDYGYALTLDSTNDVWVTGSTGSSNFPMVNPYQGTYPGSFNGFVSKISADGASLLYSSYLGGNGSDSPSGIRVDGASEIIVAGTTTSTDFPVANAYQPTVAPNQGGLFGNYGFLTKFSPDGSYLVYSTYFGGNSNVGQSCGSTTCWPSPYSAIAGVAADGSGNAYVAGTTNTYNFPATPGAYLTTNSTQQNGEMGFIGKFSTSGSLAYSTYFYESSGILTTVNAIAVDSVGSAYVTGAALSDGTFPVTSTSICDPGIYGFGCSYAFVTKFDATGSSLLYSTFLGPNNNANPQAIVLDPNNDVYVLASTAGSSFSLVNGIEPYSNGNDLLLAEIDPLAGAELFATYLGGSGDDNPAGLAIDSSGNMYVGGSTISTDFPTTQGAFQNTLAGNTNAFVAKIGVAAAPAVSLSPYSLQFASQNVGSTSQPQSVLLRNMGSAALTISSLTASGDFAESDNCGTNVPAAGSCMLSVNFTPTTVGQRTGSIVIQDDAGRSPHVVNLSGSGSGPLAALTPSRLTFSSQSVGTSSSPHTVTLTNGGNTALSISGIQIAGDYAQTNNCPASLAAGSTCTINVTFTPTTSGTRTGTVTISDSALGSPQIAGLTGTGSVVAAAAVTPTSLTFPSQSVGTSSAAQIVTVASTGNTALSIIGIQIAGDYKQTNNCPASLAAGSTCTINVTFTPTTSGTRTGTITISDSASGSPQTVSLTGTGSDFSLASAPNSDTIKAGSTATYTLSVAPVGGVFARAVKLSCSGAPAKATWNLSSSSVTPGSNPASVTLTITTTATSAEVAPLRPAPNQFVFAAWFQIPGFGLFGLMLTGSKHWRKKLTTLIMLALLLASLLFMCACAGGTGIVSQTQGTTPGTYIVTVTGASGALQHSLPMTLTVQ